MSGSHSEDRSLFEDLLDVDAFQELSESFTRLTGLATAILDLDGKVITASGWQNLCTEFHRRHPETAKRCRKSDTVLAKNLAAGQKYARYRCGNGLVDVAVPIIIEGIHVGNLFTGQFFLDEADIDFFIRQADEFGFDKNNYLNAVKSVPVLTEKRVEEAMDYLSSLTLIIASAGIDRKRLSELNKHLEKRIEERTAEIHTERVFSDALINSLPGIMYVIDKVGRFRRWNDNFEAVSGYSAEQIRQLSPLDLFADPADKKAIKEAMERAFEEGRTNVEALFTTIDGRRIPSLFTGYTFAQNGVEYIVGVGVDISERVKAEEEKEVLITQLREMLAQVKKLSGFLPICASCKKIRDDEGYWNQLEQYIENHSEAEFSHSICPECARKLYPDLSLYSK